MLPKVIVISAPRLFTLIFLLMFLEYPGIETLAGFLFFLVYWAWSAVQVGCSRRELFIFLVMAAGLSIFASQREDARLPFHGKWARFEARIIERMSAGTGFENYLLKLETLRQPAQMEWMQTAGLVVSGGAALSPNTRIAFSCRFKRPLSFYNPGVKNPAEAWLRRGITATCHVAASDVQILDVPSKSYLQKWRILLDEIIENQNIRHADVWRAVTLGEAKISAEKKSIIRNAGLSHLVVISGMHFSLLSILVAVIFLRLIRYSVQLMQMWPSQKWAAALSLPVILLYGCLADTGASMRRALLMIILVFVARMISRRARLENVLLQAAFIELTIHPWQLFSLSFQLSYLCLLCLLACGPWIKKVIGKKGNRDSALLKMARYVLVTMLTTASLQLTLAPLLLLHFGQVSLSALWNNLWAIPYFDLMIMPLAFFSVLSPVLPEVIVSFLFSVWDDLIQYFLDMIGVLDIFSGYSLPEYSLTAGITLSIYGLMLMILIPFASKIRKTLAMVFLMMLCASIWQRSHVPACTITMIDVGQGESILVQIKGKNFLIDTGGLLGFDVAQKIIRPHLDSKNIRSLDAIIITHADHDHAGALPRILQMLKVDEVWHGNSLPKMKLNDAAPRRADWPAFRKLGQNFKIWFDDKTYLECLWPDPLSDAALSKNDDSLVLRLVHEEQAILFTGDISTYVETKLIFNHAKKLQSTVLKLAHHGSATSTSDYFLKTVQPKFAMASMGRPSRFNHPAPQIVDKLERNKIDFYRTDQQGAIIIELDDNQTRITAWRGGLTLWNPVFWY